MHKSEGQVLVENESKRIAVPVFAGGKYWKHGTRGEATGAALQYGWGRGWGREGRTAVKGEGTPVA